MAPTPERSATVMASVGDTVGLQPLITPLSVANRNAAEAELTPACSTNCEPPLNTMPVGAPGTETTSGMMEPVPE